MSWCIGALIAFGIILTLDEDESWDFYASASVVVICVMFWPIIIGRYIGEIVKASRSKE